MKGPKHQRLSSFKPSNPTFYWLMSYRCYVLSRKSEDRNSSSTAASRGVCVTQCITQPPQEHGVNHERTSIVSSRSDKVFEFLSKMVGECYILGLTEAQENLALLYFLPGKAAKHFRSPRNEAHFRGVTCCP